MSLHFGEPDVMTVAAVSIKLPTFWAAQPWARFIQAEAQFDIRGITKDSTVNCCYNSEMMLKRRL